MELTLQSVAIELQRKKVQQDDAIKEPQSYLDPDGNITFTVYVLHVLV